MSHAHAHAPTRLDEASIRIPQGSAWRKVPAIAGVVGLAGLGGAAALSWGTRQFYFSYLVAYCYFLSLGLGGMFFVIAQFAGRAGWSVAVRRLAEHAMCVLPLFTVLFIPIALGAHDLYHWTHAEAVASDPLLRSKAPYLNLTAFYLRAALYFAIWGAVGQWFYRHSVAQDGSRDQALTRRLQRMSGPAIALYGFSLSFASFDWIMSLEPHWYSTIFGIYFFAGSVIGIFGLMLLLSILLRRGGLLEQVITVEHLHDLGKYLFAFTVFWAYIAFSQYMLYWYGNIPEETEWYAHRGGGWLNTSVLLAVGHFAVPLFFLLPRAVKRRTGPLALAAGWLLAMHYLDLYWLIMPTLHQHGPRLAPTDVLAFVGIGGLFVAVLVRQMGKHALVATGDPRLRESLSFENL